ncbi:MAG: ATP phosphoribosyltransferase regulatory subunit, partial [Ignavibacteria bacterium]|nr:ATP phosphoribosyltransferase regulatory subunit [Ignavibacteria bacterium]
TKNERDLEIIKDAPVLYEYLTEGTKYFFENVLINLKSFNVNYQIDYKLVRGIDYYTSTAFEFISDSLGAQSTVIGGGRYDVLVEQLGGKPTPAIGFAAGIERLFMILESNNFKFPDEEQIKLYIVSMGEESKIFALNLIKELRISGIKCETDFLNRSVKSQMKEANKLNVKYVIVIGDEELKSKSVKLKNMSDSFETEIKLSDNSDDINKLKDILNR